MTTVIVTARPTTVVSSTRPTIAVQSQGGVQGDKGDDGLGVQDALMIAARLSEFNTPAAKSAARQNLELEVIDLGTFN
jgi:hypothetical protein